MPKFSNTERQVISLFQPGTKFSFEGKECTVLICDKPRPSSGECKTDVYLQVRNSDGEREIKISIKQENADFLENKMKYERAKEIFGDDADFILTESIRSIKSQFESQYLVLFQDYKRTEAKSLKLGWKFELVNKPGGDLSGELQLTHEQLMDVYSGTNLPESKRNASVKGSSIINSGVANYVLFVNQEEEYTLDRCINGLQTISDYVRSHNKIYFACKALNYRVTKSKWDGDRPLSVFVDWSIENGKLSGGLNFSEPLKHKGNEIGNKVKTILSQLNINAANFNKLQKLLAPTVNRL